MIGTSINPLKGGFEDNIVGGTRKNRSSWGSLWLLKCGCCVSDGDRLFALLTAVEECSFPGLFFT